MAIENITHEPLSIKHALRVGERQVGQTPSGILVVLDVYAKDQPDLSCEPQIHRESQRIMQLPENQRKAAFRSLSPVLASFSDNEGGFKALEQLYTKDDVRFNETQDIDDGGIARSWFECIENAQAVRERKTVTTRLILENAESIQERKPGERVELASIASGSARGVIEVLQQKLSYVDIHARMLDWDPEARAYSQKLAQEAGVSKCVETVAGNVIRVQRSLDGRPVDIVEAVGIMDYLDDRISVFLLKQIHNLLSENGVVIASNIIPNPEMEFLHTAVGWRPMHYRSVQEYTELFLEAGFLTKDCLVHEIPTGIYSIVEAGKKPNG